MQRLPNYGKYDNYAGGKMSRWITNSGLSKNGLIWLKSNSPLAISPAY